MTDRHGAILLSWDFPEYEQHVRGRTWYIVASIVAIALLVYAFATKNFLFAVLVVMLAVVSYLRSTQQPPSLTCAIAEKGIVLSGKCTPYDRFQHFWLVTDEGAPAMLYFHPRGARPRFGIPIVDVEPDTVRTTLRSYLPENEEEHEEPTADVIGRALRL